MVIPSLEPFNEISSRGSYGSIPSHNIEEGGVAESEEDGSSLKHLAPSTQPHGLLQLEQGEVIDEVSIIANTINALLGVSLFSMPWGFQQAGIVGGMLVLALVGYLSFDTARMLLLAQKVFYHRTGEVQGYPEIAASALGPIWSHVVRIATIISCLGGCTGYLIFFGETVGQALSVEATTVIYISTLPLILLSWIRSFRELAIFTVFGVIALIVAVLAILIDGSQKMSHDHSSIPLVEVDTAVNFLGPATFLFTIHYFILSLGAENLRMHTVIAQIDDDLVSESKSALVSPIAISYVISVLLIIILGGVGFVMYRDVHFVKDREGDLLAGCEDHVCQNVILNLSPGIKRNLVGLMMSLVIILSYILILAPAREHLERFFLSWLKPSNARSENLAQNGLRTCLVLLTVIVALNFPYSASMLGAVGGLTDSLQCFVLPPMIFLSLNNPNGNGSGTAPSPSTRARTSSASYRIYHFAIILWGLAIIVYTMLYNIYQFLVL